MRVAFKRGLDKLRSEFQGDAMASQQVQPPSTKDITRYRYQHGTNLGGIFVLEQWLHSSMHDEGVPTPSEIDAVVSSLNNQGLEKTRQRWEAHWSSALTDDDLSWLINTANCNHIRLPLGYWTLGPDFCQNTPFAMQPSQVYINAWSTVKSLAARCFSYGIGVLIDLHAGPGGFGHEAHSGSTDGTASFWTEKANVNLATRCLVFIAQEVAHDPQLAGVVGIQICNEAIWDAPGMYDWYNDIISKISKIDGTLPLYISDGWDMSRALKFTRAYNSVDKHGSVCPVIVDNHRYYTFDEKDTSRSPTELTEQVSNDLWKLDDSLVGNVFDLKAAVAVYIGEYSMALAPQTWSKAPEDQREGLKRTFGHTQSRRWQEKAMGSAFWTLKMQWMPGGDWGFKQQVNTGNLSVPTVIGLSRGRIKELVATADQRRGELLGAAMNTHTEFWNKTVPGGNFEHWRFADGWELGWKDAKAFFTARMEHVLPCKGRKMAVGKWKGGHEVGGECCEPENESQAEGGEEKVGGDKIGALDLWVLKRMREAGVAIRERCAFGWEWEQGFRKGARAWEEVCGIE